MSLATLSEQSPAVYGTANGPVWLADVQCNGNEAGILDCPRSSEIGYTTNDHSLDAIVDCGERGLDLNKKQGLTSKFIIRQ